MSETLSGVVFGLAAGLTPGPLLALVIQQTLRYGVADGMKVAAAPLLTDLPIAAVALVLVRQVGPSDSVFGAVSLLGAGFVGYLAYESTTVDLARPVRSTIAARSLQKGIAANLLNPHP